MGRQGNSLPLITTDTFAIRLTCYVLCNSLVVQRCRFSVVLQVHAVGSIVLSWRAFFQRSNNAVTYQVGLFCALAFHTLNFDGLTCLPKLEKLLKELVLKVDDGDQFVYMQVTRGSGLRGHNYSKDDQNKANLWVTLTPSPVADTYKPIDVITYEDKRFEYCNCKTLNLIPSCLAATAADRAGCAEAIFHRGDIVTECAHSNVSIFKDGKVITHPLDDKILPGTARLRLLAFAEKLGFETEEREYTLDELMNADEVIVHSTGSFCIPVKTVDGKAVGGKAPEMLKTIQDALVADFNEQCKA